MDVDDLRAQLRHIFRSTMSAKALRFPSWDDGDAAGRTQVFDDSRAGRLHWREAHRAASMGLDALDGGDHEGARDALLLAYRVYARALESRLTPSERADLGTPARRRGRKSEKVKRAGPARPRGRPPKK
jgi:hypothetical protein